MATMGFIGAGRIGSQLARLAVARGYDVVVSNTRGPATLTALVADLGPKARAGTVLDAAKAGDIVVLVRRARGRNRLLSAQRMRGPGPRRCAEAWRSV